MKDEFLDLVRNQFSFLESEFGFRCVAAGSHSVRFQSEKVFVTIHYDSRRSYELGVEVGQIDLLFDGEERPFTLVEILRMQGVDKREDYTFFQASTSKALAGCIERLAYLLLTYGKELLENNVFYFKSLSAFRERESDRYALQSKLTSVRSKLQKAWNNKDYLKVVELLQPFEKHISDLERKKLEFARRRLE